MKILAYKLFRSIFNNKNTIAWIIQRRIIAISRKHQLTAESTLLVKECLKGSSVLELEKRKQLSQVQIKSVDTANKKQLYTKQF